MTTDRATKRLQALLATGVFLLVTLAFGIPGFVMAVQLMRGGLSPSKHHETLIGVVVCGVAALIGFLGFFQWARVATGRKKIKWDWGDREETSVND